MSFEPDPRRSKSKRWISIRTGVTRVSWAPHGPAPDATTAMAIEERTSPYSGTPADVTIPRRRHASAPLDGGRRYELGALIGRGGMGEVFAAYDTQIGREVAVKLLHPDKVSPSSIARFLREARIQGWLDHPSVPAVYELGSDDDGRPFFAMKRVSGITLAEILADRGTSRAGRFSERQLLRAFVEICLAIELAHTRGVLHRDLKPANMLLGEFGEVYVLDWGVARVLDESVTIGDVARPTLDGSDSTFGALGTPGYMSPEQVRCVDDVDARTDVYSLGCVLFEILVGRRLHPDGLAGMTCALAGITPSASELRPDLAPELDDLCRRATEADRAQRIGSARALGEAVQRYLDGDHDLALRRALAQTHLDAARRAVGDGLTRLATHEAGRALALDPTLPGAAELVSRLMIQPPATTPEAVAAELAQSALPEQMRKARLGMAINAGYAGLAPLLYGFGVRDVPYLSALVVIAMFNLVLASQALVRRRSAPRIIVALGYAAMFALLACMFTPLFIAPGVAAVTLMVHAHNPATGRRDLLGASGLALVAIFGVWAAEALGWISATTIVAGGSVTLVPPLDGISAFPIVPALVCYPLVLVGVAVEVAFSSARRGREAQRALHLQAWQLRQLVSLDDRA